MDKEFIEPIKDQKIHLPFIYSKTRSLPTVSDIVTSGDEWNFTIVELGVMLYHIEKHVRKAGLRTEK